MIFISDFPKNLNKWEKISQFTLIELLVVIAILAILAGLLLPVLNKAMQKGKETSCTNHLKQLALACISYRDDNKDNMPPWLSHLYKEYMSTTKVYRCPNDQNPADRAYSEWTAEPKPKYTEAYDRVGSTGIHGHNPNVKTSATDTADKVGPVSFFYEFSDASCSWLNELGFDPNVYKWSWADLKYYQLREGKNQYDNHKLFRDDLSHFPIIRCYWHLLPQDTKPMTNVSWNGNIFYSVMEWERGIL